MAAHQRLFRPKPEGEQEEAMPSSLSPCPRAGPGTRFIRLWHIERPMDGLVHHRVVAGGEIFGSSASSRRLYALEKS